jgi:hypothetical protein
MPAFDFSDAFEDLQLKPIPVPPASCPYLQLVHDTAEAAGQASGRTPDIDSTAWPTYAVSLRQKLEAFDLALRAAQAHTPGPIAAKLHAVDEQIGIGLANLKRAQNADEWADTTFPAIVGGYGSLLDASDLTGQACGFTVAPDAGVFMDAMR